MIPVEVLGVSLLDADVGDARIGGACRAAPEPAIEQVPLVRGEIGSAPQCKEGRDEGDEEKAEPRGAPAAARCGAARAGSETVKEG
jgi:hypothetical protein